MSKFNVDQTEKLEIDHKNGNEILDISLYVDEDIITQLIKDTSAEVLPMLIEHYLVEAQEHILDIQNAAKNSDFAKLEHEAHTLGSSSLALGNHTLSSLCRKIEIACKKKDFNSAITHYNEINKLSVLSFKALNDRKRQGFN